MGRITIWADDEIRLLVREARHQCRGYSWDMVADAMNHEMARRQATTGVLPPRIYKGGGIESKHGRLKRQRPDLFEMEADDEDSETEGETVQGEDEQAEESSHGSDSLVEVNEQGEAMDVDAEKGNEALETNVASQKNRVQESHDIYDLYDSSRNDSEMTEFTEDEEGDLVRKEPDRSPAEVEDQSNTRQLEKESSALDLEAVDVASAVNQNDNHATYDPNLASHNRDPDFFYPESPVPVQPVQETPDPAANLPFPLRLTKETFPLDLETDVDFARQDLATAVEEYNEYGATFNTPGWSGDVLESLREVVALAFERKLEAEMEADQYDGDNFEGWDFR